MDDELTESQRVELHQLLLAERDSLRAALVIGGEMSQTVDLDLPIGRLSRMDAMQQQKMAEEQGRRQELKLKQVLAALERVNDESYGDCRTCEEPIPYKRLRARPETPFCVPCMSRMERR